MASIDTLFRSYIVWSRRVVLSVSILMLSIMVAAHTLEITVRAAENASVSWVQEVSILAAMWVYFFAYALIAKDDQYIRVEFFTMRLRPALRWHVELFACCITVAFHATILWFGVETYKFLGLFKTSVLDWPESLFVLPLVLGAADIVVTEIIRLYAHLAGRAPKPLSHPRI